MDILRLYYVLIILNATFFGLNVYLFIILLREFSKLLKKLHDLELGPEKSLEKIHIQAHNAIEMIHSSAKKIIHSTEVYKGDVEEVFKKEYKSGLENMMIKVENNLHSFAGNIIKSSQKEETVLTEHIKNQYSMLLERLTGEVLVTQKSITEDLTKKKQQIDRELVQYEASKKQEIEKSMVDLVYEVAHKVIPDLIPQKQHEEIILTALASAQKAGKLPSVHSTTRHE